MQISTIHITENILSPQLSLRDLSNLTRDSDKNNDAIYFIYFIAANKWYCVVSHMAGLHQFLTRIVYGCQVPGGTLDTRQHDLH